MIPLFSQKHTKEDNMLAFSLLEKNEIMLLTYEKKMEECGIARMNIPGMYHAGNTRAHASYACCAQPQGKALLKRSCMKGIVYLTYR